MSGNDLSSNSIVDGAEEENEVTQFGFDGKGTLKLHHRQFDYIKYEKLYKWLYFNQVKKASCVKFVNFLMEILLCPSMVPALLGHIKELLSKIIPVKNSIAIKSLQIIKKQF